MDQKPDWQRQKTIAESSTQRRTQLFISFWGCKPVCFLNHCFLCHHRRFRRSIWMERCPIATKDPFTDEKISNANQEIRVQDLYWNKKSLSGLRKDQCRSIFSTAHSTETSLGEIKTEFHRSCERYHTLHSLSLCDDSTLASIERSLLFVRCLPIPTNHVYSRLKPSHSHKRHQHFRYR